MITNLKGRLRNTVLGANNALLPMFEAVVNSIQSIEERAQTEETSLSKYHITLEVERQPSLELDDNSKALAPITSFRVIDEGVGFNSKNTKSFETLDSDLKLDLGCKGIGRLAWLKAFNHVNIHSIYVEDGTVFAREIDFSADLGAVVSEPRSHRDTASDHLELNTAVTLQAPKERFQVKFPKKLETIAEAILEHCIWYFLRKEGVPKILVSDVSLGAKISVNDLYEETVDSNVTGETIEIEGEAFDLIHLRLRQSSGKDHALALAGDGRVVRTIDISERIPGLSKEISDEHGRFTHVTYVSSSFLDDRIHPQRADFTIAKEPDNGLFSDISMTEIVENVIVQVKERLSEQIKQSLAIGKQKTRNFVDRKAPRYKSIISQIDNDDRVHDPSLSDRDRELLLHRKLGELEEELLKTGQELARADIEDTDEYNEEMEKYLHLLHTLKQSDLVDYVFHRRTMINILRNALKRREDGKYEDEEIIHSLVMPMGKDSHEVEINGLNLWLIDERLAFHTYMSSDRPLTSTQLTGSQDRSEPDIISTNIADNPMLVSESEGRHNTTISVIEFKKPMRQGNHDPIKQALRYLVKARKGKLKNSEGRFIRGSEEAPGYCYAICDLTEVIREQCALYNLLPTADNECYFGFVGNPYNAFVQVMSLDHLVDSAEQRNHAFFSKLGLPSAQ